MVSLAAKWQTIAKAHNPKEALLASVGQEAIDAYQLFEDDLLLATYVPPEKIGSIIMPDRVQQESDFQGKCGLLLKMGPTAFKYSRSGEYAFEGEKPELNSWLVFRYSDAWQVGLNGVSCRIVRANFIRGVVDSPAVMW